MIGTTGSGPDPAEHVDDHVRRGRAPQASETGRRDGRASHWNDDPQPFVWTKTVDDIITKVKPGRATLDRVTESATHH
jgi:hypothetical protein